MRKIKCLICVATLTATALAALAGAHSFALAQTFTVTPPSPGCQLLSAPAGTTPAFCDTFDKPEGIGDRSGALNGTVWGVSRLLGGTNTGSGPILRCIAHRHSAVRNDLFGDRSERCPNLRRPARRGAVRSDRRDARWPCIPSSHSTSRVDAREPSRLT